MDELYLKFGALINHWGHSSRADKTSFDVTEAWLTNANGIVEHRTRTIDSNGLSSWLAEETLGTGMETKSLVLRLVWVDVDVGNRQVLLADPVQKALVKAFGLEVAHEYAKSCFTNVSVMPPSGKRPGHRAYSFCYVPKIASVWSHRRFATTGPAARPHVTQGLIFVHKKEKTTLLSFLDSPWNAHLYGSAMFPPFLFTLLLLGGVHETEGVIRGEVRKMEETTGHHKFNSISRDTTTEAATAKYGILSSEASGCATKLAGAARKSKMVENLLDFITRNLREEEDLADKGSSLLKGHVGVLQERLAMLNVDMEYTQKRVEVQIRALAGIISKNDSLSNIRLARSQHLLSLHSYRDSSSMKTLAIVTMFFLPGSFVSALFSTQLFDWDSLDHKSDSIGMRTIPQFKLYWIITILLTLATFMLYFLWLWLQKRARLDSQDDEPSPDELNILSLSEKGQREDSV